MPHVKWHLFYEFFYSFIYFFRPDTDVIMTLLQYLFVALIIPFSYEDKRLAQLWTIAQLTHPLTNGIHDSKHAFVPKANMA